jgi:hypothetical protein
MQRVGNRDVFELRGRLPAEPVVGRIHDSLLDQGPYDLLDEVGIAFGLFNDELSEIARKSGDVQERGDQIIGALSVERSPVALPRPDGLAAVDPPMIVPAQKVGINIRSSRISGQGSGGSETGLIEIVEGNENTMSPPAPALRSAGLFLSMLFLIACEMPPPAEPQNPGAGDPPPNSGGQPSVLKPKNPTHKAVCDCTCSGECGGSNETLDVPLGGCESLNTTECKYKEKKNGPEYQGKLRGCTKVTVPANTATGVDAKDPPAAEER